MMKHERACFGLTLSGLSGLEAVIMQVSLEPVDVALAPRTVLPGAGLTVPLGPRP